MKAGQFPKTLVHLSVVASLYSLSAGAAVLEEVVVTAQKRAQSVQDIGIAVTAYTGDQLKALGYDNAQQITAQTPGVSTIQPNGPSSFFISIRGVSQNDFSGDHQESPVAVYIDEAYISAASGAGFQLFDMERVEILRGPQGTLFGRNATGGLAHYITKKPTEEFEGYVSLLLSARAAEQDIDSGFFKHSSARQNPLTGLGEDFGGLDLQGEGDSLAQAYPALRHCVGAGEPLNPEIIEVWKQATGLVVRDGFGQTETTLLCGNFNGIEPRYGSMGKPAPGIELAVVDANGQPLPPDTEGDIGVKVKPVAPPGVFSEYKGEPQKTAEAFRGDWYLTGDRATVDADGYFWFVSRSDDIILSAGYRIGPFEVESALIEHPAVAESAVVSSPDAQRGEVVKAFVVLTPQYSASEELAQTLKDHVKTVTAPYKYPRKIEFVDQLPKTVSGKIRRVELREREWA